MSWSWRNGKGRVLAAVVVTAVPLLVGGGPVSSGSPSPGPAPAVGTSDLGSGWALRSATSTFDSGATISQPGYLTAGWYSIALPSTVLGGLVANGVYSNINVGTNLQSVPDLTGQNWWFRGDFTAPAAAAGQVYWLRFDGISYRAQIWLNGTQLDTNAVGSMVAHEYNVTGTIHPGAANTLAILVTPPAHDCNDLSFCTVDWNPEAPDMQAGIWGKTSLATTGAVAIRDPYVKTTLPLPSTSFADLTVYADAVNATATPVTTTVTATIAKSGTATISVSQTVTLAANERREIVFDPAGYPALHVTSPILWWPYQFGSPELFALAVSSVVSGAASDTKSVNFGIRQLTDYRQTIKGTSFAGYVVNGHKILFRGGGYVWDLLQHEDAANAQTTVRYTKAMGLNTIRLEGTLGNQALYEAADKAGVMIMPGFVCCSAWENDSKWTAEQAQVANASLDTQMRLLRSHPSAFMWAYGSDKPPTAAHLATYKQTATALHWQNPTVDNVATWSNANAGMKMDGPYKWEPPVLWWDTAQAGSAFGTTAEEGTESPPPLDSLQKFIGPDDLWPIGTVWNYHAGKPRSVFDNLNVYTDGLNKRYGTATGAADYSAKSELQNYETTRSFFEAWNAHEYTQSLGTIFWMLNSAWPSTHWTLYDFYFKPGGGFHGAKKANEPLHVAYDYATRSVAVVNSTLAAQSGMTATARVYSLPDLAQQYTNAVTLDVPANAATVAFQIPALTGLSTTYLVRLQLKSSGGAVTSNNLYWLSTTPDALGNKANWYMTAVKTYANLTGLNSLPTDNGVTATVSRSISGSQQLVTVMLKNNGSTLAFFLRPEVTIGNGGSEVVPIDWSDNYLSLFAGESTTLTATYQTADLGGQPPFLRVRGYNVPSTSTAIP